MSNKFLLDGRVAIVTGGGTGIGRGVALVLAEHGADVVLAGRRPEPLAATAKEIEALGRRALPVPTDVTKPSECRSLVDTTLGEYGRLDILVNNAGGGHTKRILDWTDDEWYEVMNLNLSSAWFLSRYAAKPMLEQRKGAIVNISSGAALMAMPQAAIYGAAKAGLNNLTGSMAGAWTRKGLRVNAIACGAVRTEGLVSDAERIGTDPEDIGKTNASGRLGDPEEIGYSVLFLASDASSYCSGQTLYVHGGPGLGGI